MYQLKPKDARYFHNIGQRSVLSFLDIQKINMAYCRGQYWYCLEYLKLFVLQVKNMTYTYMYVLMYGRTDGGRAGEGGRDDWL